MSLMIHFRKCVKAESILVKLICTCDSVTIRHVTGLLYEHSIVLYVICYIAFMDYNIIFSLLHMYVLSKYIYMLSYVIC